MAYEFNPFTGTLDKTGAGGGGTPGGSDTQVQFNDAGSFGGSADLTWDDTGKVLGVGGDVDLDDGGTYTTTLQTITATANRTISFPDATGTVGLVAGSSGQVIYNNAGAYGGVSTMTFDGTSVTLAGRLINSYTSLASSPAKVFTGTWFTGGTATTTKPHFLIEPTGTTSAAWSTSGTGLGVNAASGFAGNLLDLQVGGASQVRIDQNGALTWQTNASILRRTVGSGVRVNGTAQCGGIGEFGFVAIATNATGGYHWGNETNNPVFDLSLVRDAANTLAQRNGTNAQTYRLYNTYTDASNYQRTSITDDSTGLVIDQQYAGTGAVRTNLLDLKGNGTVAATVAANGSYYASGTGAIVGIGNSGFAGTKLTSTGLGLTNARNVYFEGSYAGLVTWNDVAIGRNQAGVLAITDGSTGTGYLKQTPVAVSALPAAATVGAGTRGFVSDSTVAASGNFGATVTGGGSNNVPVFSDGTNWLIG